MSDTHIDMPRTLLRRGAVASDVPAVAKTPAAARTMLAERPAGLICLALIAAAFWVLTHPYPGIIGDATVYVGRALADLDPNGIGRDMVYVHDGQSRFSVLPRVLDHVVATIGTGWTGLAFSFLSMILWVGALAALAGRYVAKPFIAIVIIGVAVLPIAYGSPQRFGFSETIVVPRPLAEALVLLALSLLAGRRTYWALATLAVATLIHPLMALAGWGVAAIVLCWGDRRWVAVVALSGLLIFGGALAGLPLLHRLVMVMDPALKAFAADRSPLLFPSHWPISYVGLVAAQAASLLVAASTFTGRQRLILVAALAVGIIGIAAQMIFGDYLSLVLVIQGQLWRTAWLTAAMGAVALVLCALALWREGAKGHVTLALLALSWMANETPDVGVFFAVAAVISHFVAIPMSDGVRRVLVVTLWAVAIFEGIALNVHYFAGWYAFVAKIPHGDPHHIGYFWLRRYSAFPILAAVLFLALSRKAPRLMASIAVIAAVLLCTAAALTWDDRGAYQKMIDADEHPAELMRAIASRPGEVLWMDGAADAWYLAARPQWGANQQGISTIFSAELVAEWRSHMQFLIDQHLAPKQAIATFHLPSSAELPYITEKGVKALCARPDAPAWIIAPEGPKITIPPGLPRQEWHLQQPRFRITEERPNDYGWEEIDGYAILPCASAPH
jgi:hypothetical protein